MHDAIGGLFPPSSIDITLFALATVLGLAVFVIAVLNRHD